MKQKTTLILLGLFAAVAVVAVAAWWFLPVQFKVSVRSDTTWYLVYGYSSFSENKTGKGDLDFIYAVPRGNFLIIMGGKMTASGFLQVSLICGSSLVDFDRTEEPHGEVQITYEV